MFRFMGLTHYFNLLGHAIFDARVKSLKSHVADLKPLHMCRCLCRKGSHLAETPLLPHKRLRWSKIHPTDIFAFFLLTTVFVGASFVLRIKGTSAI